MIFLHNYLPKSLKFPGKLTDEQVAEMNITANIQRRDVPPLELARMVKGYMDIFNKNQVETAEKFGKTQPWVSELKGFLAFPHQVLENIGAPILGWDQLRALKASSLGVQTQVAPRTLWLIFGRQFR